MTMILPPSIRKRAIFLFHGDGKAPIHESLNTISDLGGTWRLAAASRKAKKSHDRLSRGGYTGQPENVYPRRSTDTFLVELRGRTRLIFHPRNLFGDIPAVDSTTWPRCSRFASDQNVRRSAPTTVCPINSAPSNQEKLRCENTVQLQNFLYFLFLFLLCSRRNCKCKLLTAINDGISWLMCCWSKSIELRIMRSGG